MDKERNIGFGDKVGMVIEKHRPGQSKHALTDAPYKLKDIGPFAVDFSGAPVYKKTLGVMGAILAYIIYWFWYGWVNRGFVDYVLLEQMTWGSFFGGLCVIITIITMFLDFHKGAFANYKRILEMRLRSIDRTKLKRIEFKVKDHVELYNPTSGGYWRSEQYAKDIKGDDDKKSGKLTKQEAIAKLPMDIRIKFGEKSLMKLKLSELVELSGEFLPVNLEDEGMPYALLEGKRFHSVRDMAQIMEMALKKGDVIQTKDEIKDVLNLKRRFVDLAEKIRLPFVCTLCECDTKGGRVYPLFISEHSLFGGSSAKGSYVEFREHTLAQRTWAGIVAKDNVRAGVGEGVEIGMYKFYELVPDDFALLGKKEEKMRFAPVIFVTASDAQAEKMIEDFRYNSTREGINQQDLIDATVIYDSSVADELFETVKLVVARLKRKEKSEEEFKNDMKWEIKDTINEGLQKSLITGKAGKGGILRNINLFSMRSVKYLFYIVCVIGAVFLCLYLIHFYGGINLDWLFPRPPVNETSPTDPWKGNILQSLWRVFGE